MDLTRLGRIEPVRIATEASHWDHGQRFERRHAYGRRTPARKRLLSAVAPGRDPDSVEIEYELDDRGALAEVTIRDRATGTVLRSLHAGDLDFLSSDSAPGMLFERRG